MPKFLTIHHDPLENQALCDHIVAKDETAATGVAHKIRGSYSNHVVTLSLAEFQRMVQHLEERSEEDILEEQEQMLEGDAGAK